MKIKSKWKHSWQYECCNQCSLSFHSIISFGLKSINQFAKSIALNSNSSNHLTTTASTAFSGAKVCLSDQQQRGSFLLSRDVYHCKDEGKQSRWRLICLRLATRRSSFSAQESRRETHGRVFCVCIAITQLPLS